MWTLTSAVVRVYAAYHIQNKVYVEVFSIASRVDVNFKGYMTWLS